jgi:hypothetical protein
MTGNTKDPKKRRTNKTNDMQYNDRKSRRTNDTQYNDLKSRRTNDRQFVLSVVCLVCPPLH